MGSTKISREEAEMILELIEKDKKLRNEVLDKIYNILKEDNGKIIIKNLKDDIKKELFEDLKVLIFEEIKSQLKKKV